MKEDSCRYDHRLASESASEIREVRVSDDGSRVWELPLMFFADSTGEL
jgi:hypothetical protein